MTFSLTARCAETGAFGTAISSSSIAVASRCAWADPVGAVTSQNLTNPGLGLAGLRLLRQGLGAEGVLKLVMAGDPAPDWRQVGVIDRYGVVASHCGSRAFPESGFSIGAGVIAMGNLLASGGVTDAMLHAFETSVNEPFAERLVLALEAGLAAGGERLPVRSAGIKICLYYDWPVVDLRVDWADDPIGMVRDLWSVYRPQERDFVEFACNPDAAADRVSASLKARSEDR